MVGGIASRAAAEDCIQGVSTSGMCITTVSRVACDLLDDMLDSKSAVVDKFRPIADEVQTNNLRQHNLHKDLRQTLLFIMSNEMSEKTFLNKIDSISDNPEARLHIFQNLLNS
jgi:hypothetical protein